MEQKEYTITHELAQAVLNFLQQKPYGEVHLLIAELVKLKPIENAERPLEKVDIKE